MSVSDNAFCNDEAPASRIVDEEAARTLEGYGIAVPYEKTYVYPGESCSVVFMATKFVEYHAARHELVQYGQQYSPISSGEASLHAWRNIPRADNKVKPESGALYTIDAGIIKYNDTGDGYTASWQQGIAVAYLQHQGVLVLNTGILAGMLSGGVSDEVVDELELIKQRLDTFGHNLAKALGAGNGCYIKSWQPVPPSESLPGDEFPKVIQARKVAVGQALLA